MGDRDEVCGASDRCTWYEEMTAMIGLGGVNPMDQEKYFGVCCSGGEGCKESVYREFQRESKLEEARA